MASSASPSTRAVYGPVNPAILGGFDWEEEEGPSSTAGVYISSQQQRASSSTPTADLTVPLHRRFLPALLGGVSNSLAPTTPGAVPAGGTHRGGLSAGVNSQTPPGPRRRGERVQTPNQRTPRDAETTRAGSSPSNNPYAAAIEAKQNALTVAYLRSPATAVAPDIASSLAPDDLGCVTCPQAADPLC